MIKIKDTNLSNNVQVLIFAIAIFLFYLLLKPLLTVFLASIILTYLFYPVYKKLRKPLKFDGLAIFITLIVIIIIFLLPIAFIASQIPNQVSNVHNYAKANLIGKGYFDFSCTNNEGMCKLTNVVGNLEFLELDTAINNVLKSIVQFAGNVVKGIPGFVASVAFALFISFFLFKDGKKLTERAVKVIPFHKKSASKLIQQFGNLTKTVVFAHLIVALVQGAIGAIAFFILGIPNPLFWGVVMAIFALLPVIGPAIIWIPASIFLVISGLILSSYFIIGKGIVLFLVGLFIISTIDNILRVKLVGSTEVHPLTVFIGLIGGVNLFGLLGIFIGPILLSLLVSYLGDFSRIYKKGG